MEIQATRVFYSNLQSTSQVVANRGGARSSKSFSLIQLLLMKFLNEKSKSILILRKTLPSMRISTYRDMVKMAKGWGVWGYIQESKQTLSWEFGSNYLHFGSLDDPEKIKSTDWNYIYMEEANEFTYEDFMVLRLRLSAPSVDGKRNQIFLAFNPVNEFSWIKEKVIDGSNVDVQEILSTYRDNPFLSEDYIRTLLSLEEQDPNFFRIYALGEWGQLSHLIYSNWDLVDELPGKGPLIYGLDFGFNDPTVLLKIELYDGEPYVDELIYESGLTNTQLIERMSLLGIAHTDFIFADSSEPDRIAEIHTADYNIHPCEKGGGSVSSGISVVKNFRKIHFTKKSDNALKEVKAYSWKQDKNGKVLDSPVEFNDHAMDAKRYALYSWDKIGGSGDLVSVASLGKSHHRRSN